jgi:hypothetical protein
VLRRIFVNYKGEMTVFINYSFRPILFGWSNQGCWDLWVVCYLWERWEVYGKFWWETPEDEATWKT